MFYLLDSLRRILTLLFISSLYRNPYTIRDLLGFTEDVTGFIANLQEPTDKKLVKIKEDSIGGDIADSGDSKSLLIINAEMEAFEVFLNSAKDDLPLFMIKMSDAKVKFHSSKDTTENQMAMVSLGDLRVNVPKKTKILQQYSTILGLSSQVSSSFLRIEYGKGPIAVQTSSFDYFEKDETEMFMDVLLSPMRFVHVQSQILTLVEYVTEGVLGALTKRVASSAAQAAYDLAQTESVGRKIFFVKASGFDLVLPQAAYSPEFFALHVGNMSVHFTGYPTPGEGAAIIALEEVTMQCNKEERIIDTPIRMDIDVSLAPLTAPTLDDQATRIVLSTSRAEFTLTHNHYGQVMKTLELNIGEVDSFLRDEVVIGENKKVTISNKQESGNLTPTLTHGGAEEVIIKKRMYMTFKFEELVLGLCDKNHTDAILSINAVETTIAVKLFPHDETMKVDATLHDLVVEDRRMSACNRHFRKLVRQIADSNILSGPDVFRLQYFQSKRDQLQSININLGRPQLVFIPDLIADALAFFKTENDTPQSIQVRLDDGSSNSFDNIQVLETNTSISAFTDMEEKLKTVDLKLKTGDCRLVLIDMGTTSSPNISSSKWTESVILQGHTEAKAELVTDLNSGTLVKSSFEVHGENFEMYTAEGEELVSPIQLVNPIQFSAFLSTKIKNEHQIIDISFVTLSSVTMTVSMQNYALLTAIASSTVEAWTNQKKVEDSELSFGEKPLSSDMIEEIQKVSSKLEKGDFETASADTGVELVFRDGASSAPLSTATSVSHIKRKIFSVKLTLPETIVTVINDLQGIDDALFKMTVQSCVWGIDASLDLTVKNNTMFHAQANANILADYFDSHTNLWEPFLLKPWEIDFKARRGKKKGESRSTTTVDVESHPCQISFSEQMIISLRGATSMWALYSDTIRKAMDILSQKIENEQRISFVRAKASYSARAMRTTMPYGIDNRTGYSITFDLDEKGKHEAPNNTTTFFNFSLHKGDGVGGFRSYGQDSIAKKSIDIFIDKKCIHFDHLDDELNRSKKAHNLGNARFVFTDVIKTGKATVSVNLSWF